MHWWYSIRFCIWRICSIWTCGRTMLVVGTWMVIGILIKNMFFNTLVYQNHTFTAFSFSDFFKLQLKYVFQSYTLCLTRQTFKCSSELLGVKQILKLTSHRRHQHTININTHTPWIINLESSQPLNYIFPARNASAIELRFAKCNNTHHSPTPWLVGFIAQND